MPPYGARLRGQFGANGVDYFPPRREHAQGGQRATINHCLSINQYFELTVPALLQLHVHVQFTTDPRRHPDGVQARHSICTIANANPSHVHPQERELSMGTPRTSLQFQPAGHDLFNALHR